MALSVGVVHAAHNLLQTEDASGHVCNRWVQEVQGNGHLSKAADVYSFGVLLWEMYHGMPPYVYSHQKKRLVNNRSFPKFDLRPREEAPFSFVVLSLACLSNDFEKRCVPVARLVLQ